MYTEHRCTESEDHVVKSTRAGMAALVGLFLSGTVALAAAPDRKSVV